MKTWIIENGLTLIFVLAIGWKILKLWYSNRKVYRTIKEEHKICEMGVASQLPVDLLLKFNHYRTQNPYSVINTQALVEEYIAGMKGKSLHETIQKNKGVPSQVIILGVLGTFVGLVLGLKNINFNDPQAITGVLEGMYVAFYTSIAGIIGSLIAQWILNKWNSENSLTVYMIKLEMLLNTQIESVTQKDIHQKITQMNTHLSSISKGIYALNALEHTAQALMRFNTEFSSNINGLIGSMNQAVTSMAEFSSNVFKLNQRFDHLIGIFNSQEQLNKEVVTMTQSINTHLEEAVTAQQTTREWITQEMATHKGMMNQVADSLQEHLIAIQSIEQGQNDAFNVQQNQLRESVSIIVALTKESFQHIHRQQKEDLGELTQVLSQSAHQQKLVNEGFTGNVEALMTNLEQVRMNYVQQYKQIDTNFEESHQVINRLVDTYGQMETQKQGLIDQVKQVVDGLQAHATSMEAGVGEIMEGNVELMQQYLQATKQAIDTELKTLSNRHLAEQFVRAYTDIQIRKGE